MISVNHSVNEWVIIKLIQRKNTTEIYIIFQLHIIIFPETDEPKKVKMTSLT